GCALFLLTPGLLGLVLIGRSGLTRITALTSSRLVPALWLGLAVAGYLLLASEPGLPATDIHFNGLFALASGLAWGWLAVVTIPAIFPSHSGLGRIEHGDLARVLSAWFFVSVQRLLGLAVIHVPLALILWLICRGLSISPTVAILIVAPVGALLFRFWLLAAVDVLSLWLDEQLIDGDPSGDDPWSEATRAYFMGYVRRVGWPADEHLLDNIHFLPGHGDEIITYGGGLTHSRVVIGSELLEFALVPCDRPHDYAEPRVSKLSWNEWNSGLVVPVALTAPIATPDERRPRNSDEYGETEHQPLGEPPTLIGILEPDALNERPTFRPHQDPTWLDWDPGEEHDGTDPG
ncbi:MAG: hypothetical protein AAGC55_34085, partial [Myxococcota bacterium]